jgi:hypothetical protein
MVAKKKDLNDDENLEKEIQEITGIPYILMGFPCYEHHASYEILIAKCLS